MLWNLLFGANAQAQEPGWADKTRYALANKDILSQPTDPRRIVMMGNSITEFWEETHPQFFVQNHLIGRGISGQVSSQMLVRFRQDVINLHPKAVVINCGTNDIAENNGPYDEDITMDNIRSMTELALNHGIMVVLSSMMGMVTASTVSISGTVSFQMGSKNAWESSAEAVLDWI